MIEANEPLCENEHDLAVQDLVEPVPFSHSGKLTYLNSLYTLSLEAIVLITGTLLDAQLFLT